MCVYIEGHSSFILCLHSLFISHVKTVNTKENRYIKACNAFNAMYVNMVFAAFIQHCIQSTVYTVHRALCPSRREGYLEESSILLV